jgi:diguanylate cyclase (GGDEF)-like protein
VPEWYVVNEDKPPLIAMNTIQPISYETKPSVVLVYELTNPLDLVRDVKEQVYTIFFKARLVEFSDDAVKFIDVGLADDLYGLTMNEAIQKKRAAGLKSSLPRPEYSSISQNTQAQLQQFVKNNYLLESTPVAWQHQGDCGKYSARGRYSTCGRYSANYYGLRKKSALTHVVVVYKDEGCRDFQERLISNIAQSLAAQTEESFFNHLVKLLTETFGLDVAAIGEVVPDTDNRIKVLSFHSRLDSQYPVNEQEYCLKDSPSLDVFKGETKVVAKGVTELFPKDKYLKKLGVEAFICVPVLGEHSQPLGAIWLMHRQEIPNIDLMLAVLNIFSIRAAAEIERERHEKALNIREQQQLAFINNNSSGMFVVDVFPHMEINLALPQQVQWLADHTRFVDCNDAAVTLIGYGERSALLGRALFGKSVVYDFATHARAFVAEGYRFRDHVFKISPNNGLDKWLSSTISSVIKDGKLVRMLGMITDVTDRIRHTKEMEYRAKHDGLTGLANRSYFIEQIEQTLKLTQRNCKHALFLLDLDGFKEVNDTLGHEIGDYLLQQIGPRVGPVFARKNIIFSRLGGDEFGVFIQNYSTEEAVIESANVLIQAIKKPFVINELELTVGGSMGIALYPNDGSSISSLMRCADVAMYQAKHSSKDHCLYNSDQDHYTFRRLSLMMDIRQAIDNNELVLHYQPIIDLKSQEVLGFEVLIRWQHPDHGLLLPAEFVPLIELTDMIKPMTCWVVETAIKQLSLWQKRCWPYRLAVNISTRNLVDAGFAGFIESCLKEYGVHGSRLELEITESTLMADPDKARKVLQVLSELGTAISIDDYGTGYSSLAYLKSLPITTLKIDRTFISQMAANSQDRIIVNSTIQLAHNLGLEVTAEGIEDLTLIQVLNELGCDKGQGFYICRPVPLIELDAWFELRRLHLLSQTDNEPL